MNNTEIIIISLPNFPKVNGKHCLNLTGSNIITLINLPVIPLQCRARMKIGFPSNNSKNAYDDAMLEEILEQATDENNLRKQFYKHYKKIF